MSNFVKDAFKGGINSDFARSIYDPASVHLGVTPLTEQFDALSGKTGAEAAQQGAQLQYDASLKGIDLQRETRDIVRSDLEPFRALGDEVLPALSTPQGQFDYILNNPLFNMALERADRASNNAFLSQGLEGDAREALATNVISASRPIINDLFRTAGMAQNAAAGQGAAATDAGAAITDLITGGGNALAAGGIGAANSNSQGAANIAGIASTVASIFSDERLKEDMREVGSLDDGTPIYVGSYKGENKPQLFLKAQELEETQPEAVSVDRSGYLLVDMSKVS